MKKYVFLTAFFLFLGMFGISESYAQRRPSGLPHPHRIYKQRVKASRHQYRKVYHYRRAQERHYVRHAPPRPPHPRRHPPLPPHPPLPHR